MLSGKLCPRREECPRKESCDKYLGCAPREYVIRRSDIEWRNTKTRRAIKLNAKRIENRLEKQHHSGHPMTGYEHEDLIQCTWDKLVNGLPTRSVEEPLYNYFDIQMNVERKRLQRSMRNRTQIIVDEEGDILSVVDTNVSAVIHEFPRPVISRPPDSYYDIEVWDLYRVISKMYPGVSSYLKHLIENGELTASEDSDLLNVAEHHVYRLRRKLKKYLKEYIETNNGIASGNER